MSNTKSYPYIDTGLSITLVIDGKSFTVAASHENYPLIGQAIKAGEWDKVKNLADLATAVKTYVSNVSSNVEVKNGGVYYKGEQLGGVVVDRILKFMNEGREIGPLIKFVERLMANPSFGSRQRLYAFLENNNVPLTQDGTFLAYKAVLSDYRSKTSGSEDVEVSTDGGSSWETFRGHIPNNVGNIVRVDRAKVDDDPNTHCSYGLHAGGISYVDWFGNSDDKKVIVEVDPANVVSVPTDHNCGKMRLCEYKVIADFEGELKDSLADKTKLYNTPRSSNCG